MTTADVLLTALRVRAVARNAVRAEIRKNSAAGQMVLNEQLKTWRSLQKAEKELSAALISWETEEGIGDN